MQTLHHCEPLQKRQSTKPTSSTLRDKRSTNAKHQHEVGVFRNTHVKQGLIAKLLNLYHLFMIDLFDSDEYEGGRFRSIWNSHFRITDSDLNSQNLNEIIDEIENGYRNRDIRMNARHRHYDDMFD